MTFPTNSLKTAEAIQTVLDNNDWSYTDHASDIIDDHSESGMDLDPLFDMRNQNNVWGAMVKDILTDILGRRDDEERDVATPTVTQVYNLVVQTMENRTQV